MRSSVDPLDIAHLFYYNPFKYTPTLFWPADEKMHCVFHPVDVNSTNRLAKYEPVLGTNPELRPIKTCREWAASSRGQKETKAWLRKTVR